MSPFPFRRIVLSTSSVLALLCLPPVSYAGEHTTKELITALKTGGYVVYVRHAKTERDYADQVTAVTSNCATQRVLSETGWAQAKSIGAGFALHGIEVGEVVSSEYCRAWQTADLAFGAYRKSADLNFETSESYSKEQFAAMRAKVSPMLSAVPTRGNSVIVGHDDPFEAATGIYPEPQGVAYVIKPVAGGFEVLGKIEAQEWLD